MKKRYAIVVALEDNPLFNAGNGATFVADGTHRLDASVMRGEDQGCGVVAGTQCVRSPVKADRAVMEKSPLVMVANDDADQFARENGLDIVQNAYFSSNQRYELWVDSVRVREMGGAQTLGAVALDQDGNLAAATSCTVREAADKLVYEVLEKGDGGLIAVDYDGNIAMAFNSPQMWRGAADSDGRFEAMLD